MSLIKTNMNNDILNGTVNLNDRGKISVPAVASKLSELLDDEIQEPQLRFNWPPKMDDDERRIVGKIYGPDIEVTKRNGEQVHFFAKNQRSFETTQLGVSILALLGEERFAVEPLRDNTYFMMGDAGGSLASGLQLLVKIWTQSDQMGDEAGKTVVESYLTKLNDQLGKLLANEIILGYTDGYMHNILLHDLRTLERRYRQDGYESARQYLETHEPALVLFDFDFGEFLNLVDLDDHEELELERLGSIRELAAGVVDPVVALLEKRGLLDKESIRRSFDARFAKARQQEEQIAHLIVSHAPAIKQRTFFGLDTHAGEFLANRIKAGKEEAWFKWITADTSLTPKALRPVRLSDENLERLKQLHNRMASGEVKRTAQVFDQHGDPRVLIRMNELYDEGALDEVIIHGDMFDRGKDNLETFEQLKTLKEKMGGCCQLVFGNHELMMIRGLLLGDVKQFLNWLFLNGGNAWLEELQLADMIDHLGTEMAAVEAETEAKTRVAKEFLENPRFKPLKEMAVWMFKHYQLFAEDDRGGLHLHAAWPLTVDKLPTVSFDELAAKQEILTGYQGLPLDELSAQGAVVNTFLDELNEFFWLRKRDWIYRITDIDHSQRTYFESEKEKHRQQAETIAGLTGSSVEIQLNNLLRKQSDHFILHMNEDSTRQLQNLLLALGGFQYIMIGHNMVAHLHNFDHLFYAADLGRPAYLLTSNQGIDFYEIPRKTEEGDDWTHTVCLGEHESALARLDAMIAEQELL